jgi:DNA-binding MarR family transcriptional regulator
MTLDSSPSSSAPSGRCSNFKLRQLMRRVAQHYDAELGRIGLKATQYSLLSQVARSGPIRPGELAEAMTLDASTVTRNLKPLVAAGWLTVAAGSDGRSHAVTITAAGREKRNDARRYWQAAERGLNTLLGADEVSALHALIDRCLARFAALDGSSGDARPERRPGQRLEQRTA